MTDDTGAAPIDKLEISLRIGGGEIFAFAVESQSRMKSWIVVGSLVMVIVAQLVASVGPEIVAMVQGAGQ